MVAPAKITAGVLPAPKNLVAHHRESLRASMKQWQERGHPPPVLLVTGTAGIGKRTIAHYLAQWLFCVESGFAPPTDDLFGGTPSTPVNFNPEPCGKCPPCERALSGNWVDFQEIGSDPTEKDTGSLKIEQFRALKATLGFGGFDGSFKITLIRDADRLTVQAANSLLKLLEEPPPGWVFFLTAIDSSLLLPTLVSRCQVARLRPLPTSLLIDLLEESEVPQARREICAGLAQGSWGKALELGSDESWEERDQIHRFLERPLAEANSLVDWAASEPERLPNLITRLEEASAELLNWTLSPNTQLSHRSLKSHSLEVLQRSGSMENARSFWLRRSDRLFRARGEALAPLNRKLLAQEILLAWIQPE